VASAVDGVFDAGGWEGDAGGGGGELAEPCLHVVVGVLAGEGAGGLAVVAVVVAGGVVAEFGVGGALLESPQFAGFGVDPAPGVGEHFEDVAAAVVEGGAGVVGAGPRPNLVGGAGFAFGAGPEIGGAVGFEEVGPGDVAGEPVARGVVAGGGGAFAACLVRVGGGEEELDEPVGGVGDGGVVGVAGGFPFVAAAVGVDGGWGEDLAAFAADVEAGSEGAG
jgi:hypothetical protein